MPSKPVFEHTPGPWGPHTFRKRGLMHANGPTDRVVCLPPTDYDHAVACVNGCDAAGITHPGALAELLELAEEAGNRWPSDRIRAALRAVRGE